MKTEKTFGWGWRIIITVAVFALALKLTDNSNSFNFNSSIGSGGTDPYYTGPAEAYRMGTVFIKDRLKAPSTAKFSDWVWDKDKIGVSGSAESGYVVRGWVDAQNSFGAKLRSKWVCHLRPTGR